MGITLVDAVVKLARLVILLGFHCDVSIHYKGGLPCSSDHAVQNVARSTFSDRFPFECVQSTSANKIRCA